MLDESPRTKSASCLAGFCLEHTVVGDLSVSEGCQLCHTSPQDCVAMNLSEWANLQGIHPQTAYRWFREGTLPV
ncbi:MAG: hypothetical protein ACYDEH_05635, partial [Acidimicrobiales bacterium]